MPDRLLGNVSAPTRSPVVDVKTGMLTRPWADYFARLPPTLDAIPARINAVSITGRTAAIPATDFSNGVLAAGAYRLTYYARVASPGGGELAVTFRWTDGGVASSFEGIALVLGAGETTGTMGESTIVRVDKGSPITYETDWTPGASYNLDVTLERVYVP